MSMSADALVAAAEKGLNALGFVVGEVDEAARRLVAFRTGPYSRQELALQVLAPGRLRASMRVCNTDALVGAVRWQPASMARFGIPDEGAEYGGQTGLEAAVDDLLGVMESSVLPALDRRLLLERS